MKKRSKAAGAIILAVFFSMMLVSCGKQEKRFSAEFPDLFHTASKIVGYAKQAEDLKAQSDFIYERLSFYHKHFNAFRNFEGINNIKTINDHAGVRPVPVDRSVIELLEFCKEGHRLTDGRVNVAMGSVLELWYEQREAYRADEEAVLPTTQELQEAAKHCSIDDIIIDPKAQTVYLADPKMRLDVGAIAKGYAVQRVVEEAKEQGIERMLLSIGGNVAAIGTKPGDELWQVGVQNPDRNSEEAITAPLRIKDCSLVSSGDHERFFIADDVVYGHIIDPQTLFPPRHFRQVSILCEDSGLADLYSTALFILPLEEGRELIEKADAEAMWVLADGRVEYSSGFRSFE